MKPGSDETKPPIQETKGSDPETPPSQASAADATVQLHFGGARLRAELRAGQWVVLEFEGAVEEDDLHRLRNIIWEQDAA